MPGYLPSKKEFDELAKQYPIVPVWRQVVSDLETPVSAFTKLAPNQPAFLLESVEHGERWGRYSFVGVDPFLVMMCKDGLVHWEGTPPPSVEEDTTPLEMFRQTLDHYRSPTLTGLPPFFAGAVGYLGYDVIRYLERLPQTTKDDVGAPELLLMFPRTVVAFDHLRQQATIVTNVLDGDYDGAVERGEKLASQLGSPLEYKPLELKEVEFKEPESTMTREEFEAAIEQGKEYIADGDIFQVVLAHRLFRFLDTDPFDVYRILRLVNPSPYMFFVRHPEITVFGSSPEPLVKVEGRRAIQRPIAGTQPRGSTPEEDRAIEEAFVSDEKERAEHVMLVDLARNDLGRVCKYGTVSVEELMIVERYSHVMHLVSQVVGELADNASALDALYASFPAGTVSGAPKIRAMEIIDELEVTRRGPYAGVVGYFDFSGNLDTCIALRTAYVKDRTLHIQAGAGIVADSDPSSEWSETLDKAKAILTSAQIAEEIAG
jgi:anthranilate synthase component 1